MTAEHRYISDVLRSLWHEYVELRNDMATFSPKPIEDYEDEYQAARSDLIARNPHQPVESMEEMARQGIQIAYQNQFSEKFSNRMSKLFVSVLFMSHALCEALINQILILRFHDENISELYEVWERAKFEDKWLLAPKSFLPSYNFDKSGQIYQTLKELVAQRNFYTHYKPMIEIEGKVIYGKERKRKTFEESMRLINSFISLPYDLCILSSILMKDFSYQILLNREEIPVAEWHQRELDRISKENKPH
ncbi:hypothetical protein ACI48D_04890 [Massilia sp. LXY-6]|uniref:hypothetical protein n=1 Tax=Massilia sp. LXY-6 TaxID=3379823 RepID=UPI003EDFE504